MNFSQGFDSNLWFLTEVQPHRQALRAWLLARFPTVTDVDNLVQESFSRVVRAREASVIRSPRALLYATARNLALDMVRRQQIVRFEPITEDTDSTVLLDTADVVAAVTRQEELELLTQAIQSLPARCRQVLTLRTAFGFTPGQIAEKLKVSESTVEKEMAKGIRRCAVFFAAQDGR